MSLFFIVRKKLPSENMSHFSRTSEFEREFSKLSKKYRSLSEDLIKIVKTRLACKSLRNRSIRIIYAYKESTVTFVYIEIYFKGDKENEDRERINLYLKSL